MKKKNPSCPCGSSIEYKKCCEPVHHGQAANTAEQLMRSRYAAFSTGNEAYLLKSWHPSKRPETLNLAEQRNIKWVDLKVIDHQSQNDHAEVEFITKYKLNGKAEKIHERSRFVREQGRWLYVDGDNIT